VKETEHFRDPDVAGNTEQW